MRKIISLRGVMGSGKTHFAKDFVKNNINYIYIDSDHLRNYYKDEAKVKDHILAIINNSLDNVIIDDYFDLSKEILNCMFEWWFIYTNPDICLARFYQRTNISIPPYTIKLILSRFNEWFNRGYNKYFEYNTSSAKEINKDEVFKMIEEYKKERIIKLIKNIKDNFKGYFYQGFIFPYGLESDGLRTDTGEFLTDNVFNKISQVIDFKNKEVIDLGCYFGYFCFKAKEKGAKVVTGVDCFQNALSIAEEINSIFSHGVNFIKRDLEEYNVPPTDIVFVMSVLQHLDCPFYLLKKVFKKSKIVVIELDLPTSTGEMEFSELTSRAHDKGYLFRISKSAMDKFADGQGFRLKFNQKSPKQNRELLIYEKKE